MRQSDLRDNRLKKVGTAVMTETRSGKGQFTIVSMRAALQQLHRDVFELPIVSQATDFGTFYTQESLGTSLSFLEKRYDLGMAESFRYPQRAANIPASFAWYRAMLQQQVDDFRVTFKGCCV